MEINTLTYNPSQLTEKQGGKAAAAEKVSVASSPAHRSVKISSEDFLEKVSNTNKVLDKLGQGVAFSIDESTKSPVVQLIDKKTNEVIKQYPNEDALRMLDNIQKYLSSVKEGASPSKESLTGSLINEII